MAISQQAVIGLSILYTGVAPSASDLSYWSSPAAAGITWDQAVVAFATSAPAQQLYPYLAAPSVANPTQYVTQVFFDAYGIAAADIPPAELAYWVNWISLPDDNGIPNYLEFPVVLNQYSPASRQQALLNKADVALDFAQKMLAAGNSTFTITQYGNSQSILLTVTADPATVVAAKAATDIYVAGLGTTTVLTTGIDNLSGTTKNDIFVGDNSTAATATVQAADQVNGGGGKDTFKYYGPTTVLPSLVDVERVELLNATTGAADKIDFSPLAGKGIQEVILVGSAPTLTVKGLNGITLGTDGVVAAKSDITGDFGAAATAATFSVTASTLGKVALDGKTINTLNLVATKINTIDELSSTGTEETLKVSGEGSVTVTKALDPSIKTIDASSNKGGVTLTAGNSDLTFTGGIGPDTLTFAAAQFTSKDVLDGGAGKDTLIIGDVVPVVAAVNAVKNFETLGFNGAGATLDVSKITAFTDYLFQGAGPIAITQATSTNTFTLAVNNNASTLSLANKLGDTTANLTLQGKGISTGDLTLTGITTLNLASNKGGAVAGANKIKSFVANPDNMKIVVTGDQDLTIPAPNAVTTGVTVDAAAFKANLNATGTTKIDSLTGGIGVDTLTGGLAGDLLTGGTGADTFVYAGAADSNAGSLTTPVSYDTIGDFAVADDKLKSPLFVPANLVAQGTVQAAVNASGATDLSGAIATAATAIGVNKYGAFQIGGSTYVLANDAALAVSNLDLLIGLTGNLTLTSSNFAV